MLPMNQLAISNLPRQNCPEPAMRDCPNMPMQEQAANLNSNKYDLSF
jgi:hypothetical protein